jgi:hypothetical protein
VRLRDSLRLARSTMESGTLHILNYLLLIVVGKPQVLKLPPLGLISCSYR